MHLYTLDSRLLAEARGAVEEAAASVHEEEEEARDSEEEEARNYSEDEEVEMLQLVGFAGLDVEEDVTGCLGCTDYPTSLRSPKLCHSCFSIRF